MFFCLSFFNILFKKYICVGSLLLNISLAGGQL